MRVLISGASGLIGTELQKQLSDLGHTPVVLVRRNPRKANEVFWDPETLTLDSEVMESIDAVVNLAGATTGKLPWTREYKKELIASRINSTRTIVQAIAKAKNRPKVLIRHLWRLWRHTPN
jgi:NAD dependent epimerase/dehydratase family enzyme